MKHKFTTAMMIISVALLGVFIWFFERDDETTQQRNKRTRTVFAVDAQSISRIQLERGGGIIECTKASGTWRLTHPSDAPVNLEIVEQMIAGMAHVARGELITTETLNERGMTPTDYGFDEPRARITFENDRGVFTWLIGRDAPLGEMLYVMAEGGATIIATSKNLLNLVPEDPSWIRDHSLFSFKAATIRGIDLTRASGFLQLRQKTGDNWKMQQPQNGRLDPLSVHTFIEHILEAKIATFITDEKTNLTEYGLDKPAYELTLFTQDEQTQALLIGQPLTNCPELRYAKWIEKNSIFTIPDLWTKQFELNQDLLRNRQLLSEPIDPIHTINITSGEHQIELIQTNQQWSITRPVRWEAESVEVRTLLTKLSEGFIDTFIDTPNDEQLQKIESAPCVITLVSGDKPIILRISERESSGFYLVKRDDDDAIYFTAGDLLSPSFNDPLTYRTRTLLQISPDQIESLTLKTSNGEFQILNSNGQFISENPENKLDTNAVFSLLSGLADLQAEKYIKANPESLAPYGLEAPEAQLTVKLKTPGTLGQILLFGNSTPKGRFAMLKGQDIVLLLPAQTAEILTKPLLFEENKPPIEKIENP